MKPRPLVIGLGFSALFFAILLPPEAYPDGKLAVILAATFAFFASLSEGRIPATYIRAGVAGFAFLLLHTAFISIDPYRSLEFTTVLWAYYCLFGFFLYAGFDPLKPFAVCMVVLAAIVSGYGLYQYFWGFDQLYSYIFYAASDQVVKVPALERIATKRVFSTLALPGTLWGFLVAALPFHALLWTRNRAIQALLTASMAMLLAAGFLTRSFGFLAGLLVLALSWMVLRYRRIPWRRIGGVMLALVLAGGIFYSARKGVIEGANPASLRLKNWISAWTIFAANPVGTGLNTYGIIYSQYKLPDANETQYTHNTPLQLLSELGYIVLLTAAVLFLAVLRAWKRGDFRQIPRWLLLALIVWTVHNLIDINVYFPSLGVVGAVLFGVVLHKPFVVARPPPRLATALSAALGVSVLVFAGLAMVSTELQYRGQAEFEQNKLTDAAATLAQAQAMMPLNSSLFHNSGDINLNLFHKRHDARYLEAATASFRRAVELSPAKSGSYVGLGLCLSSANAVEAAIEQVRIARHLYPDSTYVQSITRLLEQRRRGLLDQPK